jgi:lipoprotein-anchoring transpeptidase ErfK/SrfK
MGEGVVTNRKQHASLILGFCVLAAGCGSAPHQRAVTRHVPSCRSGAVRTLGSAKVAYAAAVRTHARAYRRPGAQPLASFARDNRYGVPTVFGVRAAVVRRNCRPAWYRVQLPIKPNGVVGYVRARDVRLSRVRTRIVVDVSAKRLTYFRDGKPVLRVRVGVGSPRTPTPLGRFYVNESFREDPSGPYGPAAIGISAYSNVLTWWADGGPIAIHGTNRPSTIGEAASNGCIHVPNAVARLLFRITPAGTPVVIAA